MIMKPAIMRQQTAACNGRACSRLPVRPVSGIRRFRLVPQATAAAAPTHSDLVAAVKKLAQLSQQNADKEQIEQQIATVTELSAAAGTNKVFQDMNDGSFKGYTLTGQTAQRFASVITLGVLSFNIYQPKDLKIKIQGTDSGGVFKGKRDSCDQAYVIATPFEVVEQPDEAAEAVPTGIKGRSLAIGEYQQAPDNPQRLIIKFQKMRLEPAADSPADLQRWLDTFAQHNPNMDPATGVLEVPLPAKSPEGWMDYLLMVPEYQLVQGNFGSKTLLERV